MKKSIFLLMLLSSMIAFSEKLTTNGKDNLDKLKGNWDSIQATISNTPKGWYILSYDEPDIDLNLEFYILIQVINIIKLVIFILRGIQNIKRLLQSIKT